MQTVFPPQHLNGFHLLAADTVSPTETAKYTRICNFFPVKICRGIWFLKGLLPLSRAGLLSQNLISFGVYKSQNLPSFTSEQPPRPLRFHTTKYQAGTGLVVATAFRRKNG